MSEFINKDENKQYFNILIVRNNIPYIIEEGNQSIEVSKENEVKEMANEFKKNNLVRRKNIPKR